MIVADWYEQNKARVPPGYTLDKISGEIKTGLREQSKKEKRDELIDALARTGLRRLEQCPNDPAAGRATGGRSSSASG